MIYLRAEIEVFWRGGEMNFKEYKKMVQKLKAVAEYHTLISVPLRGSPISLGGPQGRSARNDDEDKKYLSRYLLLRYIVVCYMFTDVSEICWDKRLVAL